MSGNRPLLSVIARDLNGCCCSKLRMAVGPTDEFVPVGDIRACPYYYAYADRQNSGGPNESIGYKKNARLTILIIRTGRSVLSLLGVLMLPPSLLNYLMRNREGTRTGGEQKRSVAYRWRITLREFRNMPTLQCSNN